MQKACMVITLLERVRMKYRVRKITWGKSACVTVLDAWVKNRKFGNVILPHIR